MGRGAWTVSRFTGREGMVKREGVFLRGLGGGGGYNMKFAKNLNLIII